MPVCLFLLLLPWSFALRAVFVLLRCGKAVSFPLSLPCCHTCFFPASFRETGFTNQQTSVSRSVPRCCSYILPAPSNIRAFHPFPPPFFFPPLPSHSLSFQRESVGFGVPLTSLFCIFRHLRWPMLRMPSLLPFPCVPFGLSVYAAVSDCSCNASCRLFSVFLWVATLPPVSPFVEGGVAIGKERENHK